MTELNRHGIRNLNAPEWRSIRYVNSRGFIVPAHLSETIHTMLRTADPPATIDYEWAAFYAASFNPETQKPAPSVLGYYDRITAHEYTDAGGMCTIDRPCELFDLPGLQIEIPSEDVNYFAKQLRSQVVRSRGGRTFYLMFGWMDRCFVLTERTKAKLEAMFVERLPSAEVRSRVFYANRKTAQEVLREHNATKGMPKDAPIYAHDERAQYRPRERGES